MLLGFAVIGSSFPKGIYLMPLDSFTVSYHELAGTLDLDLESLTGKLL